MDDYWASLASGLEEADSGFFLRLLFGVLLQQASAFCRRVLEPMQQYPSKLLWLAKERDEIACCERQQVANELLQTPPLKLEINARKCKALFETDLKEASSHGVLKGKLRVFVRGIARMWRCDTRDCERINKHLTLFTERGPTTTYELLSSRACIKHFIGESCNPGVQSKRKKWSEYRPTAERLMSLCLNAWPHRRPVQSNVARWEPPPEPDNVPADADKIHDKLLGLPGQTASRAWAVCYNMILNKKLAEITASDCPTPVVSFLKKGEDGKAIFQHFVSAEKIRTTRRFVPCKADGREIWLSQPMSFLNSIDVIASFWSSVRAGSRVKVFIVQPDTPFFRARPDADGDRTVKLQFLGTSNKTPLSVFTLEKPSAKMTKIFEDDGGHDKDHASSNDSKTSRKKADTGPTEKGSASESAASGSAGPRSESDVAFSMMLKEARRLRAAALAHGSNTDDAAEEEEGSDAGAESDGQDDQDGERVMRFLDHVMRESSVAAACSDELEDIQDKLHAEAAEETFEAGVEAAERKTAVGALQSGVCPLPSAAEVANYQNVSEGDGAAAAFVEAVLNHSGQTQ